MTNEELILKKLEDLETKINPIVEARETWLELKNDLLPLQNQAVELIIRELQEVEAGFQLEDLFILIKQAMRSTRNMIFMLHALDNVIEFATDMEPLLKSAVPKMIEHLDELEQKGVFRIVKAMMDIRAKVADAYDADDIDQIGDGFVSMLRLAKTLSDPKAMLFLEKMAALPGKVDLDNAKPVGAFGLMGAGFNREVKQGLGVMMELTKAMGSLKSNGQTADQPSEKQASQ
jgi:uncharacterized protein YjgD (DUF1641 family)